MALDEERRDRMYTLRQNLDDEIATEIKKMENDLELYAEGDLTPDEFMQRIKESEGWIMQFVRMQTSILTKMDVEENGG
jgi:hypothetical protein